MSRLRIVLFGLTGLSNPVLHAIAASGHELLCLVTRKEAGPFPYYCETSVSDLATELGIPVFFDSDGENHAAALKPDLILVATYHRRLKPELIASARHAINLHPSLLPRYRGPIPYYWMLINGEPEAGITAHLLDVDYDRGDILWQEKLPVPEACTQGELRRLLANLAGRVTSKLLDSICQDGNLPASKQEESAAEGQGRPPEGYRLLNITGGIEQAVRQIRALHPWPKAELASPPAQVEEIVSVERDPEKIACARPVCMHPDNLLTIRLVDALLTLRVTCVEEHRP